MNFGTLHMLLTVGTFLALSDTTYGGICYDKDCGQSSIQNVLERSLKGNLGATIQDVEAHVRDGILIRSDADVNVFGKKRNFGSLVWIKSSYMTSEFGNV